MVDTIDGTAVYADAVAREENDFYPTPPEPTRAILNAEAKHLERFDRIWEPACGDGAMVREIEAKGFGVHSSDMIDRGCGAELRSFYHYQEAPAPAILTNPPFCECNSGRWIMHALHNLQVEYMALLLPFNFPGAESRARVWSLFPPARVYLMRWRIDFTGAGAPPMLNAWFVWDGKTEADDTRLLMLSKKSSQQEVLL